MRASIEEYKAVEEAAMKFVKSVAEGNSQYAKELFIDEAVLFGYLDGQLEHGSIEQFYRNVDTVGAGNDFKARIDVVDVEETLAVVRVLEEKWGGRIDFTDYLLLMKMNGEWKCVAKAYNQKLGHDTKIRRKENENSGCYRKPAQAWQQFCHVRCVYPGSRTVRAYGQTV